MNFKKITTAIATSAVALSLAFTSVNPVSETVEAQASTATSYKATLYVKSYDGKLNVRKSASAKSAKIVTLNNGVKVTTTLKKKVGKASWVYISANGKKGWVNAAYLSSKKSSIKKVSETSSDIIAYGEKFLGTPYVWGGTTPRGFDCSGFTGYVYKNVLGKSLPRTSGAQYSASRHISKDNAEVGDLVFFSASGSRITHVAIYAGNNRLLHAAGITVYNTQTYMMATGTFV